MITFDYDELDGYGVMYKTHKIGEVEAYAFAHPDDMDIANQWDSARICEFRCDMELQRLHRDKMWERYQSALSIYNHIKDWYATRKDQNNESNLMLEKVRKQMIGAWKQYKKAKEEFERMRDNEQKFCNEVTEVRRAFRKKYEEQD